MTLLLLLLLLITSTIIIFATYCATRRDRVTMAQAAGHAHNFRFHLADIWKYVGMQRIGPRKLSIHLNNQS